MKSFAVITLSSEGDAVARRLLDEFDSAERFLHASVQGSGGAARFTSVIELTTEIFDRYDGLIYIMPTGVVVRAVAGLLKHKTEDPAVTVVDVGGRYAISLLSGHEGGANDLTIRVANILAAEPVITTTTEALKRFIVGVGCKSGTSAERIEDAIRTALAEARVDPADVRLIASVDIKSGEPGLIEAARRLGAGLRFVASDEIRRSGREFARSEFVQDKVGLPAVAEPAALLAGRRTELLLNKKKYDGVTVAIASESCLWSE